MHKRTIAILLTVILAIAVLAGCGGSGNGGGNGAGGSNGAGSNAATGSQGAGDSNGAGSQETAGSESTGENTGKVRIGSKDFTENEIVAELYSLALEDAGYDVTRVFDISSSLIHQSIVSDEIDIYPEYTGTGLLSILQEDLITDPDEVYNEVKAKYEENFRLTWLDYAQANDGQGIFISKEISDSLGIRTISDLQAHATEIRFASQGEFDERDDGIPGLTRVYGEFNWKSSKVYDNGLKYEVIEKGEADASPAYTTEGQLSQTDKFVLLEDDKQVWPPYNLAPVVRDNILADYPGIADILNKVSATLDTQTITDLNAKVDVEKQEYEDVAKEYWESIKGSL